MNAGLRFIPKIAEIASFRRYARASARERALGRHFHTLLSLNNQDACLTARVGDVFAADLGEEDISCVKRDDAFCPACPVVHINRPVQDCEHVFAFIHVPRVRLIGPVQARRCAAHVGDVYRSSRLVASELLAANDPHVCVPPYDAKPAK